MKKYDAIMLKTARLWAGQSKCRKRKVGAVIAKDGRIISVGYNGLPSGYKVLVSSSSCDKTEAIEKYEDICEDVYGVCPECSTTSILKYDDIEYVCERCKTLFSEPKIIYKTKHENVIHAEANAILFAAKNGIPTQDCTLYVTTAPCSECAKMIIQSGIKRVVYLDEYDSSSRNDGLELLKAVKIETEKIDDIENGV